MSTRPARRDPGDPVRGQRVAHPARRSAACRPARAATTPRVPAPVEQLELDAGGVDRPAHQPAERIDLADEMALGRAANRRVAGHQRDGLGRQRAERHAAAEPRRGPGRLAPGVPGADDDDVEVGRPSFPHTELSKDVAEQIVGAPPAR